MGLAVSHRMVREELTEKLPLEETPDGGERLNLAHLRDEDHSR